MANASSEPPNPRRRALVVSSYAWDWQRALTLEGALELKNQGYEVHFLEMSDFNTKPIRKISNWFTQKFIPRRKFREILRTNGILLHNPHFELFMSNTMLNIISCLTFVCKNTHGIRWDVIYPGLVDLTGDVNVSLKNYKKLIHKIALEDYIYVKLLNRWYATEETYDQVLIVNGRFPLNRASALFFKEHGSMVNFIEYAANREKFQIYLVSPHSESNRRNIFEEFVDNLNASPSQVKEIGENFFISRRSFDSQANIRWTRKMSPKEIPDLISGKKICTFYPTSEKEFAGVRDLPLTDHFKDQFNALDSLISNLGEDWQIFIRRHPNAKDDQNDVESELWERYADNSNLKILDPDSSIDSYALGMCSDLVAHYSSFIGPELIFSGHPNVITLGPTAWESLDPNRHLSNSQQLRKYLSGNNNQKSHVDLAVLGYFMSTFGVQFKVLAWDLSQERWILKEKGV